MKFTKGKLSWGCSNKKQKKGSGAECDDCCRWCFSSSSHEERTIPKDVPKGHVVIYVGESHKRFVIKMNLLDHPLFKALLDQAHDVYDLPASSKLCIPCDENLFLNVVQCAQSSRNRRAFTCLILGFNELYHNSIFKCLPSCSSSLFCVSLIRASSLVLFCNLYLIEAEIHFSTTPQTK